MNTQPNVNITLMKTLGHKLLVGTIVLNSLLALGQLSEFNRYYTIDSSFVGNDSLKFIHKVHPDFKSHKVSRSIEVQGNDDPLFSFISRVNPNVKYHIIVNSSEKQKIRNEYLQIKDTVVDSNSYSIFLTFQHEQDISHLSLLQFKDISIISAEDPRQSVMNEVLSDCFKTNRHLKCINQLGSLSLGNPSKDSFKLQMELTFSSFLGSNDIYDSLIKKWDQSALDDKIIDNINLKGISGLSRVIGEIILLAKDKQVIMFNENHFYPSNRIFVNNLLPKLYENGFKYLALEALESGADYDLNSGFAINDKMGLYTREPEFINLIENARKLGFKFISYDSFSKSKDRDLAQAENIYNNTLKIDQAARVVVLAGISHIYEHENNIESKPRMAEHFKKKYHIDPLTISQTNLSSYSRAVQYPTLISSDSLDEKFPVDYLVIHDLQREKEIFENFKLNVSYDSDVQISIFRGIEKEAIEDNCKVPKTSFKNIIIKKGDKLAIYLNPEFSYWYEIYNEFGNVIEKKAISF